MAKRRTVALLAGFAFMFGALGCASVDLQTKIDKLQADNDKLREEIVILKTQQTLSQPGPREEVRPSAARSADSDVKLSEALKNEGVTATKRGDADVLTLPNKALFPSGVAALSAKGRANLDEVVAIIKKDFPRAHIRIEGHTDSDPISRTKDVYKSNWELSGARSLSVLHYMTDKGIEPERLSFAGYGEYQPLDPKSKAENRRVELVLIQR